MENQSQHTTSGPSTQSYKVAKCALLCSQYVGIVVAANIVITCALLIPVPTSINIPNAVTFSSVTSLAIFSYLRVALLTGVPLVSFIGFAPLMQGGYFKSIEAQEYSVSLKSVAKLFLILTLFVGLSGSLVIGLTLGFGSEWNPEPTFSVHLEWLALAAVIACAAVGLLSACFVNRSLYDMRKAPKLYTFVPMWTVPFFGLMSFALIITQPFFALWFAKNFSLLDAFVATSTTFPRWVVVLTCAVRAMLSRQVPRAPFL
jgi:hypothetical protein